MFDEGFLQRALLAAPVILFSLTVHEFFHAWTAMRFGDPTAKNLGRLTLNPLAHLDLMGTMMMVLSGFRFGWAKPVPVNPSNFDDPRWGDLWVSAAGPLSNFGMAIIAGLLYRAAASSSMQFPEYVYLILFFAVSINVTLAFFNLIPLFPLDGSHILRSLLPPEADPTLDKLDMVAPFILIGMVMFGMIWVVIGPLVNAFTRLIAGA